ncbi:hypothetical protein E0Z10_g10869 [Xylaria hypoxylon]|uniref:Uncharacterized protein n=1 Tax=Xylaria hypoxylon TaxID=37992 RepID=A0A4Z0XYI5_9PEZI|nr:hypothetical protein E0Z10_g10869 [Xylaria hypoxylon]
MSAPPSRIAQFASIIALCTRQIDDYLAQNALPYPALQPDTPVDLGLQPDLENLRVAVLEATQELLDLLQGPRDLLFKRHARYHNLHNQLVGLKLISRFGIANQVLVDGEITYGDLASKAGVNEAALG